MKNVAHSPKTPSQDASARKLYLRLLSYIKPYRNFFVLMVVSMLLTAVAEPLFPAIIERLFGALRKNTNISPWLWPSAIFGLFLFRAALDLLGDIATTRIAQGVLYDIRKQLFARYLIFPLRFFDQTHSGQLISRIVFDVNNLSSSTTSVVSTLFKDSITVVALMSYLLWQDWRLTIVTLIQVPLVAFVINTATKRMRRLNREMMKITGDLTHVVQESIDCQKVVKIYGGQAQETFKFSTQNQRNRGASIKLAISQSATGLLTQTAGGIAMASVIFVAFLIKTEPEKFIAFVTAMMLLMQPIKRLSNVNGPLQRSIATCEVLFELLDQPGEIDSGKKQLTHAQGHIEFQNVCLRYPGQERLALNHINLTIKAGETIAIVGASGGGKTSLINVLPRFLDLEHGQILIDNIAINELSLVNLREQIAMVGQEVVLFNDTLRANIAYGGQTSVSDQRIWQALDAAHLTQFVEQQPDGLNTMIGEKGMRLSGGQRQRLAIARAILKNAPILILDEATSALDSESERHVQTALEQLMKNRTTLVVAHRLSTIEKAHRIVVMEQGQIKEIGTHDELLRQQGIYANLYQIQYATGNQS